MNDFSLVEKLNILMNVILSSPLFLILLIVIAISLIFFIIKIITNKKINKWIFIGIWLLFGLILVINYNKLFINLIDNLFDSLFMALYFPDISVYLLLLLISNFFFIYSFMDKKISKSYKIVNVMSAFIIDLILVIVFDIVNKNNINIQDRLEIFSNSNLLVLLQLSTAIFTSWLLLNLLISAHHKLKKYDKKEPPEIIFD